jgi:hypothetical protein
LIHPTAREDGFAPVDLRTADFVVEWQLGRKVIASDVPMLVTSKAEDIVTPEWSPLPDDDRIARRAATPE